MWFYMAKIYSLQTLHLTSRHNIWSTLYRHNTWPTLYRHKACPTLYRHYTWPFLHRQCTWPILQTLHFTWCTLHRHYAWPADTTFDLLSIDTTFDLLSADNMLHLPSTDTTLDLLVIHIGCSLVQHQYVVLPKDCSGQTDQLPLSHTQVLSALRHLHVQTLSLTLNL